MAGEYRGDVQLDSFPVNNWLKDLRMECYRKHLDDYPTVLSLMEVKESDFKKLGITNTNDRSVLMSSLARFRATTQRSQIPAPGSLPKDTLKVSEASPKSTLLKGPSLKKLKGLLGGASFQKKTKKNKDHLISGPANSSVEEVIEERTFEESAPSPNVPVLAPIPEKSRNEGTPRRYSRSASLDNGLQNVHLTRTTIENDYVPDPQNSPQLPHHKTLMRTYTASELDYRPMPRDTGLDWCVADLTINNSPPPMAKHHSLVSMESGYSFGCEEDFNPSLPLHSQPWYHDQITKSNAEAFLQEDGDFLVRENILMEGTHVLSVMWGDQCLHFNVQSSEVMTKTGGTISTATKYQLSNGAFDSVPELIFNHLRYQIPVEKEMNAIITNPVCKVGTRGLNHTSFTPDGTLKYHSTTVPRSNRPSSASALMDKRISRELLSPDSGPARHSAMSSSKPSRSSSFSPHSSARSSPARDLGGGGVSSGRQHSTPTLLQAVDLDDEDEQSNMIMASIYRDTTPSPDIEVQQQSVRPYTESKLLQQTSFSSSSGGNWRKNAASSVEEPETEDGDDYEVMESVIHPPVNTSPKITSREAHYALLGSHQLNQQRQHSSPGLTAPGLTAPLHPNSAVKYAEVSFNRSRSSTVVTTSPYANPSDLARNRADSVNYVSLRPINPSPHPFSGNYIQLSPATSTHSSPASSAYSSPQKPRKAPATNYASISSLCFNSPPSSSSSSPASSRFAQRPVSIISRATKPPQTIHEINSFVKDFTNQELAVHLTKSDAVCFLLTARPGENEELWQNRVQEVSVGTFIGLQILATSVGEKLWKKLYFRHLSLSHMVAAAITTAGDTIERAKAMKKFIELASLLQSGAYGNLFSFMAIMKGLSSPQVTDLKQTWTMLRSHFSDAASTYDNELVGMITALNSGASVYAIDQLTIPAVQHLSGVFKLDDDHSSATTDLLGVINDFSKHASGLSNIHEIVAHTADLSHNAKMRLDSYPYNAVLFDFFMQDNVRVHLQQMGTSSEHALERYRRFSIVLDAVISKFESP